MDITERKQDEEKLELALREAEAANQAKDQFLAIVSHELRTPLTTTLGWHWLLRSGKLDEAERAQAMDIIERGMQHERQIIEDLLDVSTLARGQVQIGRQIVDLCLELSEVEKSFSVQAHSKRLSLSCAAAAEILVEGDPARLRQVFAILVANAMKFTPAGGEIKISARRDQEQAVISIEDTGPGIAPDFYPYLFTPFRQQEGPLTRGYGGLGLGLAIAKRLIELHGGLIKAEPPVVGKGAKLTVILPLVSRPASAPVAPKAAAALPGVLKGARILVVEDDADTRSMLSMILTRCEAQVQSAASAREGFDIFCRWHPDVLLSDIAMPGEDGCSLIQRIRTLPEREGGRIPALALTAYSTSEDKARALACGFQLYLAKPVDPEELIRVVRELVKKSSAFAQQPSAERHE
jgi:CheY-like chemotaxis protein/anti-sigma regulatory factor (Ser/Thr protein kinase)